MLLKLINVHSCRRKYIQQADIESQPDTKEISRIIYILTDHEIRCSIENLLFEVKVVGNQYFVLFFYGKSIRKHISRTLVCDVIRFCNGDFWDAQDVFSKDVLHNAIVHNKQQIFGRPTNQFTKASSAEMFSMRIRSRHIDNQVH